MGERETGVEKNVGFFMLSTKGRAIIIRKLRGKRLNIELSELRKMTITQASRIYE
jgi:hypothetical protein